MLMLVDNLQLHLLSNCTYYPGTKPGKKHALNKQYALNSELCLLTRVYGMWISELECGINCDYTPVFQALLRKWRP